MSFKKLLKIDTKSPSVKIDKYDSDDDTFFDFTKSDKRPKKRGIINPIYSNPRLNKKLPWEINWGEIPSYKVPKEDDIFPSDTFIDLDIVKNEKSRKRSNSYSYPQSKKFISIKKRDTLDDINSLNKEKEEDASIKRRISKSKRRISKSKRRISKSKRRISKSKRRISKIM
jgi:hypothetical protein